MADTALSSIAMNYNALYIGLGFTVFSLTNYLTKYVVPDSATNSFQQKWKWRNVATSLFHSIITGVWSPIAFYQAPDMCNDLIHKFTPSMNGLVCCSIGYFIYDAFDMILYHRKRSTYELLVHHFLVIVCYTLGVVSQEYVAYAALSLMVEVNSVFLHTRQLFIITGEPKSSLRYKSIALLNVGTFLFFRILLLGWMTRWLTVNRDQIPLAFFTVGSVGLAVIVLMNIVLFCRVLSVDFSDVLKKNGGVAGKVDPGKAQNGNLGQNGRADAAGWHERNGKSVASNYISSMFDEVEEERKDRID